MSETIRTTAGVVDGCIVLRVEAAGEMEMRRLEPGRDGTVPFDCLVELVDTLRLDLQTKLLHKAEKLERVAEQARHAVDLLQVKGLWHNMRPHTSGVWCGADYPGMRRTDVPERGNCPACAEAMKAS